MSVRQSKGRCEDLFDQSSGYPKVPYAYVVEAGEDPTKVDSWLDPKRSLSTNFTKESYFLFQREDQPFLQDHCSGPHILKCLLMTFCHLGAKLQE